MKQLVLALLAVVVLGTGAAYGDDWDHCRKGSVSIDRCTALIEGGGLSKANLAKAYNHRGIAYALKSQNDRAIADFDRAIELKPDNPEAYSNRGHSYGMQGQHDRAIADYDRAIELKPDIPEAYNNRGNAYSDKGRYDRAIADYDRAIELKPDNPEAYSNRGRAYGMLGQHDRAIADYDRAIELKPDIPGAYNNRGKAYSDKGRYDRAIADYDRAIELKPDDPLAYYNRGNAYSDKGQNDRAIADYDRAIELKPDDPQAYNNRGVAFEELGKTDRAIRDYKKALSLSPTNEVMVKNVKRLTNKSGSSAQEAPLPATGQVKAEANTDILGTLLSKKPASDAKKCAAFCEADSACVGWTWNVWNAMCFTKSSAKATLFEPSSVSGMRGGAALPSASKAKKKMVRYRGKSFDMSKGKETTADSFEECEASCQQSKKCAAFTYVGEGENQCFMFTRVYEAYSDEPELDSGVKRQVQ